MKFDIEAENLIIKPYKDDNGIYVRKQKGKFQKIRANVGWILMALFVVIPWFRYQGEQAILLDIANQQFTFFSVTLFPQDFPILAWLFIVGAFLLFFFTTWLGRVWCGYMCPQTVWSFIYIWFEEKFEGTRNQRIKLDQQPWSFDKLKKKALKHGAWLTIAFLTSLTFMSYFIPVTELYAGLASFTWSGLVWFWIGLFTLCTYGNAGFLREKMCIYMCPYSRFQSAMFDKNTLLVAYDKARGENRGRRKRNADPKALNLGDCVDCNLCVEVCPVGIDIRNGLQYECINCGACADACNQTMEKFGYQPDLISYTSENALKGKKEHLLRPKILGYGALSIAFVSAMVVFLATRVPLELSVLRDRNALYRENFQGDIENTYTLNITNKSQQDRVYRLSVTGLKDLELNVEQPVTVKAREMLTLPVTITAPDGVMEQSVMPIRIHINALEQNDISLTKDTSFYGHR
ncbi:cytochrome c oxidase accessory protein CcoG [Endozoicomonas sp. G2_1]|uniref:cytochrome c oxidase accessory protein CcoG n=1 Tax=Endozoicomonas sp. G2_1 TaxID=2821091 RepID=UPI001ADD1262|nr:cytochrome c oxidase accessory protein CcoG [Endozoicomonas sp. G2_1]MBO9491161.1 cytochrome c oxidase accessory protein CcoG [Endozoicomonas sp. G2_1]